MNDLLRMLKELTSQKKTAILDIRRKMLRYTKKRQHSDWKKKHDFVHCDKWKRFFSGPLIYLKKKLSCIVMAFLI
jgi:hypothetical protein